MSTFELTITRIATRVKKIVSDKIGSTDLENEDDLESYDESYDESSDDDAEEEVAEDDDDKDEDNNEKWKRRRRRPRKRHHSRKNKTEKTKRLPSSSSDYESDDEFDVGGPDSVIGSGLEDNAANDDHNGNFSFYFTHPLCSRYFQNVKLRPKIEFLCKCQRIFE